MTSPSYHIQGSLGPSGGLEKMIVTQEGVRSKCLDIYVFPSSLGSLSKANKMQATVDFIAKMFKADPNNKASISSVLKSCLKVTTGESGIVHISKSTMTDSKSTTPATAHKDFAKRNRICMTQNHPGPVLPVLEVGQAHTPEATLSAQYYLGVSNEKFQYIQQYGGDRFASKEKRQARFKSILGDKGNGWLKTKKHVFKSVLILLIHVIMKIKRKKTY